MNGQRKLRRFGRVAAKSAVLVALLVLLVPLTWAVDITVDGDDTDWSEVVSFATDVNEGDIPDQYDIRYLYCTRSTNGVNFYWRFDVHETYITMNTSGNITTCFDNDQNPTSGCSDPICTGSEARVYYYYDAFVGWRAAAYTCAGESWGSPSLAESDDGGNDYEAGATMTQLDLTGGDTIDILVHFENGDAQSPDDNANGSCDVPTAVKLTSFTGRPAALGILLNWETATEVDNAGFHLYRSLSKDERGERLTQDLIPSQSPGQALGASYAFLDTSALAGVTYYYTLVDVDFSNVETPHGPVMVALWRAYLPLLLR